MVCMAAQELKSGRHIRLWQDDLRKLRTPPFPTDESVLYVAYFASAEFSCHLALGWPLPARVFDCYTEFRNLTNGRKHALGNGLLAALAAYGLDGIAADEKHAMRDLVLAGGPWTDAERRDILEYCAGDVVALDKLFPRLLADVMRDPDPLQRLGQALLRGRYMKAVAHMEHAGVPVDTETLARLRTGWTAIQDRLISEIDKNFGVFDGRTFKQDLFAQWLAGSGIPWPTTDAGHLALDRDTFRQAARAHPEVAPLRELRHALSEMRLNDLAVGSDGRNRTLLYLSAHAPAAIHLKQQIYLWAVCVAARTNQTQRRTRAGLRGFFQPGGCHCRRLVWRFCLDGSIPDGRRVPGLCQTGGTGAGQRDQTDAQEGARPMQSRRVGGAVRHASSLPGPTHRTAGNLRQAATRSAPSHLPTILGMDRRRRRQSDVIGHAGNCLRVVGLHRPPIQPARPAKLSLPSQRRGNATPGLLPGDRGWFDDMRARA